MSVAKVEGNSRSQLFSPTDLVPHQERAPKNPIAEALGLKMGLPRLQEIARVFAQNNPGLSGGEPEFTYGNRHRLELTHITIVAVKEMMEDQHIRELLAFQLPAEQFGNFVEEIAALGSLDVHARYEWDADRVRRLYDTVAIYLHHLGVTSQALVQEIAKLRLPERTQNPALLPIVSRLTRFEHEVRKQPAYPPEKKL